jgi:predicted ATPase
VDTGCPEEGRHVLASIGQEDRRAFLAAEVLRLEGELHPEAAERWFREAIALARSRAEKSLELRAATSLARLLAGRGQRDEARALLGPVYGWFTEGFTTRDLREAKALLGELGG